MPLEKTDSTPAPKAQPYETPQDEGSTLLPMLIAGLVLITIGYTVIMLFV